MPDESALVVADGGKRFGESLGRFISIEEIETDPINYYYVATK